MAGVFGEPLPDDLAWRYWRIRIAQQTGWTLASIDGLGLLDWLDYLAVTEGLGAIRQFHTQTHP